MKIGDLLAALDEAKQEDLDAIDDQAKGLQGKLDSLRALRRVMAAKLGVESNGSGRGGGKRKSVDEWQKELVRYLSHSGPKTRATIMLDLKISSGVIGKVLDHGFFEKSPNDGRIGLTLAGKSEAQRLAAKK